MATSCLGQGTLVFANNESTLVLTRPGGSTVPESGGFVQLLWAPAGSSFEAYTSGSLTSWLAANPAWSVLASSSQFIGPLAGRFDAGVVTVPTATPGAVIEAAVACWLGNYASFDAAVAGGSIGNISSDFSVDTGNPNAQPQPEPPASILGPEQFAGMVIVPEPGSLTLALLAGMTVALARRRLRRWRFSQTAHREPSRGSARRQTGGPFECLECGTLTERVKPFRRC